MSLFEKYIEPPTVREGQEKYEITFRKYINDLIELFDSSGLQRSNVDGNLDTINMTIPDTINDSPVKTTPRYSNLKFIYDMNDINQISLPVRITIKFGIRSNVNAYALVNYINCSISLIDINNNSYNTREYISDYNVDTSTPTISNYRYNSFIINNEKLLSINIAPKYFDGDSVSRNTGLLNIVIYRSESDSINIYGAYSGATWSCTLVTKNEISTSMPYYVYNNLPNYLAKGKLITFPIFYNTKNGELIQNPDLVLVKSEASPTLNKVKLKIDDLTEKTFVTLGNSTTNAIASGSVLLVRE